MKKIFTEENYADIKKMVAKVERQAKESTDPFHMSSYENIYVVGDELFKRFCNDYLGNEDRSVSWWFSYSQQLKNDSTIAEVKTVYFIEYHFDANGGGGSWDRPSKFLSVFIDGEILRPYFGRNDKAADFSFLEDKRDYYHKMPYRWGDDNPAPNKCGQLTDKKIKSWLDWLRLRRDTYDKIVNDENDKVSKFLDKVKLLDHPGLKKDVSDTRGKLVMNNIKYSYTISDGHIHEELAIDKPYDNDKLSAFFRMATGTYDLFHK